MDLSDGSDDEDYDPTMDEDKDLEEEEGAPIRPLEGALVKISRRRANVAEDIFSSMVKEENNGLKMLREKTALVHGTRRSSGVVLEKVLEKSIKKVQERVMNDDTRSSNENASGNVAIEDEVAPTRKGDSSSTKKKKKGKTAAVKAERNKKLLSKIFGKTKASAILDSMGNYDIEVGKRTKAAVKGSTGKRGSSKRKGSSTSSSSEASSSAKQRQDTTKKNNTVSNEVTASIKASLKNIARKTKVVETRKFAGQEVTVERNEMAVKSQFEDDEQPRPGKSSSSSSSSSSNRGGALDSVLDTIKGPKTISTVTKSAFDWQTHKAKEGLEDELAPAAKDGYLAKQDFLTRVDVRRFEKERDERLRQQTNTRSQA